MRPTDLLKGEHDDVRGLLKVLQAMIVRLVEGRRVDLEDLEWTFEFNRDYVDRFHHGREEYILYPALKDEGVPECPLSELFAEHEVTRSLAKAIRGHIEDYKQQDASSKIPPEIIEGCLSYTDLLLDHMDTEEKIFFPLADECFTKEAQERMAEKFQTFELERIGLGRKEELRELIDHLKNFY